MGKIALSILLTTTLQIAYSWDTFFHFSPCYQKRMEERMPLSMDNFVALIEQYERLNYNTSPDDIANALLFRYRKNGIIYKPTASAKWSTHQDYEVYKQEVDEKLLKPSIVIPDDTFIPREECSLHRTISHSVDIYPFAGVDQIWQNNNNAYGRRRRATSSGSAYYGLDSSSGITNYATHPIENGVVQTGSGPVAVGLLLAGIMSMSSPTTYSVSDLVGRDVAESYMPTEMKVKKVDSLFGATLSGKLAQAAILTGKIDKTNFDIGPSGKFGNSTSCPRIFSLESFNVDTPTFLTRAEINAAVDGLIIAQMMNTNSGGAKLSQILRMYYGSHGFFNNNVRSCNRNNVYKYMRDQYRNTIEDNALNYMYVYQNYFSDLKNLVAQYNDDFSKIEAEFEGYLKPVIDSVNSYMTSSSNNIMSQDCISITDKEYQFESMTDLVVVYTPIGTVADAEAQAEYIAQTARLIGVGYDRSRLAVYNGKSYNWIVPMTNVSNIADYACNYTTFRPYGTTSSQEFVKVLHDLAIYYNVLYNYFRNNPTENSKRSQVVVWNLPNSFSENIENMKWSWEQFNASFPDVSFIFVGDKPNNMQDIFTNEYDVTYVSISKYPETTAGELVYNINRAPKMFFYAACDTLNASYLNFDENRHVYTSYVSPNFTSLIKIPPQNFKFSSLLKLTFKTADITVCMSRVNKIPSKYDSTDTTKCQDASSSSTPWELTNLCDRYVELCDPIYIAVTGNSNSKKTCSNKDCLFPNQIEFEMTHEGMICGCWNMTPAPIIMILASIFAFFRF